MPANAPPVSPLRPLLVLGCVAVAFMALFMLVDVSGPWDFVLPFRGKKVATALLVGYAVAVSTVLFQTVTGNRVLTPAIMGFDYLYVLIQTCLVFFLGSTTVAGLDPRFLFGAEVIIMVAFSAMLHGWLFGMARGNVHLLLLTGVVMGVLFRSLSSFVQRVIEPNEFIFLQDRFFASFNDPEHDLLLLSAVLTLGVSVLGLRLLRACDVLVLGREAAINLGVDYQRTVSWVLALVAILVAVSTALVGPVTFLGLLVANIAYAVMRTYQHAFVLPAAALIAAIALIAGQFMLERVFRLDTNPRVIIEFVGGMVFIAMLMRKATR
ncbi:ferric siderophore ABC transporter, permease protein [Myxococcus xanthus DK 1622]|uniref:Ferric siderophore ABC transporter permease protein n=1 Tax=Myxococcus xanthus (strain DK1622) TaxID=246197 RepID=Q1DEH0_MYXXD|nr:MULTISPECIES: iron chelate uptake ABC transporter family permease subunit [Myxococcus]ABF91226.1 ferric siderophore ABC transporter, permease protein [Myxococcus xanthus DK 1622]NOJ55418.1 iron chelate uptake ABC transporter family permease subunit [Myxococcus xanthus]QLH55576.1 ferric siderophore ABC transporter permease protein [Myxococcus xanthus DK 1622]QPM80370.1 iron chelate uptake ABC transporter family permease subunit [Myxococcus xanthus]QVW69433.1 iron chelate uptake ABC transport